MFKIPGILRVDQSVGLSRFDWVFTLEGVNISISCKTVNVRMENSETRCYIPTTRHRYIARLGKKEVPLTYDDHPNALCGNSLSLLSGFYLFYPLTLSSTAQYGEDSSH